MIAPNTDPSLALPHIFESYRTLQSLLGID